MLRKVLDKLHPTFAPGGKLEKLYPLYEALDTFLYTPGTVTKTAAHVRDGMDLKRVMVLVVAALLPCFFMAMHNTGYQANLQIAAADSVQPIDDWRAATIQSLGRGHDPGSFLDNFVLGALYFLPVYIVTMAVGGAWEVLFAMVRGHEVNEGFLVTGALFPLTLPATIPLWQVALGISFGVVIGKEIFGGTGKNFMNPALTARAFLYFAYPGFISGFNQPKPNSGVGVWVAADGVSGATALGAMATAPVDNVAPNVADITGYGWWDCFFGYIQGSMGETSVLACLLGAVILIATGVGSWKIMAGCVAGLLGMSAALWAAAGWTDNPMMYIPPWWHLVIGGFAFGAVFMATDPVSAAMTDTGRWIYGVIIGVMTVLIRVINPAYPEGIMLAILFGNVVAPLIDYGVIQANIKRRTARYAT
ncbi:MAG: NADH:ubiquinone reductase (Na(+)-transporting) subunit B [Planctomycetaceae bacterium]|nr:NADH:ubiquinone reductase (Na(+)-transporting) subunit B [Planctomycetaceae bacterium]